jgi:hypothetical protein
LDKLAGFVQTVSYSGLGYASKTAFQNAWHTYLTNNYINTPPPVITIGAIRRFGETWFINYSPYPEKDADGNTLTYYITVTGEGFSKTYTDTGHSGGFSIPRSDLKANATYTVAAKSWDGITYTLTSKTKTFITANIPPTLFAFTAPGNGQTAGYDPEHRIRLAWTPVQAVDTDGDAVTDRITVESNGQGKTWEVPGGTGFLQLDSADLQPGRTYTLRGERTDGTDTVSAIPVTFTTSNLSGIDDPAALSGIRLWPVPAGNVVNISADLNEPAMLELRIFSGTGQLMHHSEHPVQGGFRTAIDVSDFPPGIYLARMAVYRDGKPEYRSQKIVVDRGR